MKIIMAGIDYSLAGIDIREKFSLTESRQRSLYEKLKEKKEISGSVIITTCNRTEIYLSCGDDFSKDPFSILCGLLSENPEDFRNLHRTREGRDVFWHLCRLACGVKSQIWGEDQIITQVKGAITRARECGAADCWLEVLFRQAVTAAKRIKTEIKFSKSENSVADKTLAVLQKQKKPCKRVMVIGNGEIGRMVASTLATHGYEVWMTLRQYKYGLIDVPEGVHTLEYGKRYEELSGFDAVVSATLSPHYTLEEECFAKVRPYPGLLVDLAVPRDIEVSIQKSRQVQMYDVDTIAGDDIRENHEKILEQMEGTIEKYYGDFQKWCGYKEEGRKQE